MSRSSESDEQKRIVEALDAVLRKDLKAWSEACTIDGFFGPWVAVPGSPDVMRVPRIDPVAHLEQQILSATNLSRRLAVCADAGHSSGDVIDQVNMAIQQLKQSNLYNRRSIRGENAVVEATSPLRRTHLSRVIKALEVEIKRQRDIPREAKEALAALKALTKNESKTGLWGGELTGDKYSVPGEDGQTLLNKINAAFEWFEIAMESVSYADDSLLAFLVEDAEFLHSRTIIIAKEPGYQKALGELTGSADLHPSIVAEQALTDETPPAEAASVADGPAGGAGHAWIDTASVRVMTPGEAGDVLAARVAREDGVHDIDGGTSRRRGR